MRFLLFVSGMLFGLILCWIISNTIPDNKLGYRWGWEEAEKSYYKTGELKYEWQADSVFVKKIE